MKKEIITICGGLGSGKSSTAKKIAEILDYQHFSSGDFFRQIAVEMNLSVTELNILAEKEKEIDFKVDDKLRNMSNSNKVIIDSRTAYHWIPNSFKIYLDLPPEIAKYRVLNNLKTNIERQKSEKENNIEEVYNKMQARFESEQKRYLDLYNIDNTKKENFNLIIDTNKYNLQKVVEIILKEYKDWLTK